MADATYHHDYDAFDLHVLASDWMLSEMKRRADKVRERAEATAPVGGEGDPHPGLYKDSFDSGSEIRLVPNEDGQLRPRAYGVVTNSAPYAIDLEYGSKHNKRYRTLGHALDAAAD